MVTEEAMRTSRMSLMADVAEGFGNYDFGIDDPLLEMITAANVACGFHAGDPVVMDRVVGACVERGVDIGAHPGFRDLVGFGRRTMQMTADEVYADILYQLGALSGFVRAHRSRITHVTPHGRLGNLVVTDHEYALGVARAVASFDAEMLVVTQSGVLADLAREMELGVVIMGLADRGYRADGTLLPRSLPGALLTDVTAVRAQVSAMVETGHVVADDGTQVPVACGTVLIHGDNPAALEVCAEVRATLSDSDVELVGVGQAERAKG